jgi:hypothetical protein
LVIVASQIRRVSLVVVSSVALVLAYFAVLVPALYALLALSRPASSLDDPPGLVGLILVLLVLVGGAVGGHLALVRAARALDVALVAVIASLWFVVIERVRSMLAGEPLDVWRLVSGFGLVLGLLAPAALLGAWLGARIRRRRLALRP